MEGRLLKTEPLGTFTRKEDATKFAEVALSNPRKWVSVEITPLIGGGFRVTATRNPITEAR